MLELRKKGNKHWLLIDDEIGEFTPSKFTINRLNNVITIVYFNNLKSKDYNVSNCYIFDIGDISGFNTSDGVAFMDKLEELNCPCFQKDINNFYISGGTWGSITGDIESQTDLIAKFNEKLSNTTTDYDDATTPLSDTDKVIVFQSGTPKITNKSDFGGGGTAWDLADLTKYSIYAWKPQPANWYSFTTPTVVGTADNASPIFTGTQVQKATRRRYVSASTAGSSTEFYEGSFRQTCMGCGFFFSIKFAFEDASAVANARSFAGLFSSLAVFGNVNPSTQTNIFGVGADSGDTNLQLIHNDSAGTATKVDLGSDFPANTSATDEYLFQCYNLQGETSSMWWRLVNVTSMIPRDWAEVTTDLPVSTSGAYINPRLWRNNGSTALAVRLSIMDMNLYKML